MDVQERLKPSVARKVREGNIRVLNPNTGAVRCNECGAAWAVNAQRGGRMPRGWWKCFRGCNWER